MRSTHLITTILGVIAAPLVTMLVTAGVARSDKVQDVRENGHDRLW